MKNLQIIYSQVGDNYDVKDPIKKFAQKEAAKTRVNLKIHGFEEISYSRGESAFVWRQGNIIMASVVEGLGTKNLVADEMRKVTGKSYYDIIAWDAVATIVNDLITVGTRPLVINAYWAVGENAWFVDEKRLRCLIKGWKDACDAASVTWGGGETPTLKGILEKDSIDLGGSAVGIIYPTQRLIMDKKLRVGDRILLLRSNGINANGISLARAVAKKLPKGYATKLSNGKMYGEEILRKTNIYAKPIQDLLDEKVDIHYISNITGHGLRKIMRAKQNFTYIIENVFDPQELFLFIQKYANLSDYEMYKTFNMGMDYAIFLPEKHIKKAQEIIRKNNFKSINAGYVAKGKRQVIVKQKNLVYKSDTLDIRVY